MPKPYAILAVALIANGRSLSTGTLTAPREHPVLTPIYGSEDRFVDSDSVGIFDFESHLAAEPMARRGASEHRAVVRIARGYELGSQQIFPHALAPCDADPR